MQESKSGTLTVNGRRKTKRKAKQKKGETEDRRNRRQAKTKTGETEDRRNRRQAKQKTKRKTRSTASSCRTSQRELRLWLSGVDESRIGEAPLLSNASRGGSVGRGSKRTTLQKE